MSFVLAKPGEVNVLQPTSAILGVERPVGVDEALKVEVGQQCGGRVDHGLGSPASDR